MAVRLGRTLRLDPVHQRAYGASLFCGALLGAKPPISFDCPARHARNIAQSTGLLLRDFPKRRPSDLGRKRIRLHCRHLHLDDGRAKAWSSGSSSTSFPSKRRLWKWEPAKETLGGPPSAGCSTKTRATARSALNTPRISSPSTTAVTRAVQGPLVFDGPASDMRVRRAAGDDFLKLEIVALARMHSRQPTAVTRTPGRG